MNAERLRQERLSQGIIGSGLAAAGEFMLFNNPTNQTDVKTFALANIAVGSALMYNTLNHPPISEDSYISHVLKGAGVVLVSFLASYAASRGMSSAETLILGTSEISAATTFTAWKHKRRTHREQQ